MQTFDVIVTTDYLMFVPKYDKILTSNCVYFVNQQILIDPGNPLVTSELILKMNEYGILAGDVKYIFCTHLHIDHIGAFWKFPNATVYASQEEINAFLTSNRYFLIDDRFYNTSIRQSLSQALNLLCKQKYENVIVPLERVLNNFSNVEMMINGSDGFYVFPSHTPGSTVIVINKTVMLGDIFSLDKRLDWIPRTFHEKIKLLHALKIYGKKNIISGHNYVNDEENKKQEHAAHTFKSNTSGPMKQSSDVRVHHICDENGRIIGEYYIDKEGNRTTSKDGFYEVKYCYNNMGKISKEVYFDLNGNAVADTDGRYGSQFFYNDEGQWVLQIDLDAEYKLRKNGNSGYHASVYYHSKSNDKKIIGRVDFKDQRITKIKYYMNDFEIEPEDAHNRYNYLIDKVAKNQLV